MAVPGSLNQIWPTFSKMLLCEAPARVKLNTCIFQIYRQYSRPSAAVVGSPLTSPFEVRPGQEPINTEESHVSENALSGRRHSQLLLSILAHPHLCSTRLKISSNWGGTGTLRVFDNVIQWEDITHRTGFSVYTLLFHLPEKSHLAILFWQRRFLMTKNRHEHFEANPPTLRLTEKWP